MCGIQNVIRKHGIYYYRKLIRLGSDKPFRIRLSLKTTSRRRAALLAPALTLICERVAMNMVRKIGRDGLTGAERAEIYRRQMLVERDRLEAMHASLHILPPDDHEDISKALTLRLGASEMAAQDGAMQGKTEDFLVARIDPENDDEPIVIVAWSDLAQSIEHEGAEEAAVARLAEIGVEQSALREAMARKVVNEARIVAIREFREVLANPGAAYPPVPIGQYESAPQHLAAPATHLAPVAAQPTVAGPWATMTPTEAMEKFFAHNPKTGGKDGKSRKKNGAAWTAKTRKQALVAARLLEQVMEGRPLAQITHDDLVTLNDCFEKVHGETFLRSPRQQAMTIVEIVEEYEAQVIDDDDTGMRLDEISSLELDEIEHEVGYWQIQVKPNALRGLKTDSSERVMPVASELLRLGFIQYVEALRAAGEWLLFPELLPESGIGTLGDAFYKTRWTHLAKKLPFLVKGQANHSFRHTTIDEMKGAGISGELRADFAGHKLDSETEGRYSDVHMALLRDAAEKIPKVTDHLNAVQINLLPDRLRVPRKARPKRRGG